MEHQRIQFEASIDDVVDARERYWKRTKAGQSQRRRGVIAVAAAFTVSLFVAAFVFSGGAANPVAPVAIVVLVLGGVFWPLLERAGSWRPHEDYPLVDVMFVD